MSTEALSRKKRVFFWLVIAAIPLVGLEAGARVYLAHQLGASMLFYGTRLNRENGDTEVATMHFHGTYFKYHPHQKRFTRDKETGRLIRATINAHGFRGPEFETEKAAGVTRVVALGASSTFGFSDRDDETYPHYLRQMLNEGGGGRRFEVINLGIPHMTSRQILAIFEAEALPLHPDVVTFYEGINDSWSSPMQTERTRPAPNVARATLSRVSLLRRCFVWVRAHSVAVFLADGFLRRPKHVTYTKVDLEAHLVGKAGEFVGNVAAICDECRKRGILFIVVSQQSKSFFVDRDHIRGVTYQQERERLTRHLDDTDRLDSWELYFLTHAAIMDSLTRWAQQGEVPFVDGIDVLDARRDCLVTWVHLNAEGNRILARAIADAILARV